MAAEETGVAVFWPEVRFSHPLVRSAVYATATASSGDRPTRHWRRPATKTGTSTSGRGTWPPRWPAPPRRPRPSRRRQRSGPENEAGTRRQRPSSNAPRCSPPTPAARRAPPVGGAGTVPGRGGRPGRRAARAGDPGAADPLAQAHAIRLRGRIQLARGEVTEATATLLTAADGCSRSLPARPGTRCSRRSRPPCSPAGPQPPPPCRGSHVRRETCRRPASHRTHPQTSC